MRRAWSLITRFVPEGAALLSALIFASYVMGLVRDRIFAQTFGAGPELDAYNAAFVLPELLFDVLVEAGLAAAFIPIFVKLRAANADPDDANRFGRTILTLGVGVMGIGSLVLLVFAEAFTGWIAPGFVGEQRELYVGLFRVMLVTQVLFAASLTLGQVLLAEQRFFWYGLAPLLYNAGIVAGTITLGGTLGIFGAAVGAILGAAAHLGSRFIGLCGSSFRIRLGCAALIGARVHPAHDPEAREPAGRAGRLPVLHERCLGPRGGQPEHLQLRPELPEPAGEPRRRRLRDRRLSLTVGGLRER
jgi:putative peptidoglycan lipid II flippase